MSLNVRRNPHFEIKKPRWGWYKVVMFMRYKDQYGFSHQPRILDFNLLKAVEFCIHEFDGLQTFFPRWTYDQNTRGFKFRNPSDAVLFRTAFVFPEDDATYSG